MFIFVFWIFNICFCVFYFSFLAFVNYYSYISYPRCHNCDNFLYRFFGIRIIFLSKFLIKVLNNNIFFFQAIFCFFQIWFRFESSQIYITTIIAFQPCSNRFPIIRKYKFFGCVGNCFCNFFNNWIKNTWADDFQ